MKMSLFAALAGVSLLAGAAQAQDAPRNPMNQADTNNDGTITKEEIQADANARFAMLDTNKDGKLTAEERTAAGARGQGAGQGGGGGSAGGGGGFRGGMGLGRADTDGDGAISQAEMLASAEQRFTRMDANNDGKIDATERQNMRGFGRGPGGGNAQPSASATPSGS